MTSLTEQTRAENADQEPKEPPKIVSRVCKECGCDTGDSSWFCGRECIEKYYGSGI